MINDLILHRSYTEPQDIPESYFLDEELDSDYETFITSLKDISVQSSVGGADKVSPQSSSASKKRKKRKAGDKNEPVVPPVSPISPDQSQENVCPGRNSLSPSGDRIDEQLSPTALVKSSTPQRSRLSQKGHNNTMNRKRLSDLFQQPDKATSVVASRSVDSALSNNVPPRR